MKVLSIGNSFSQDAQKWLHKLAEQNSIELECVNLYIGGCSLERHWNNILENRSDYDFERNGGASEGKVSVIEALRKDTYDAVTLQQFSGHSGRPQSYFPYITHIADIVREEQPNAELYFHETWAYETDSQHTCFTLYNNDQQEMFRRIEDAAETATKLIGAKIIPAGAFIQKIRNAVPEFDYRRGGVSLNRDGYHLSFDYGRYAAAVIWFYTLTGKKPDHCCFEDLDCKIIEKILAVLDWF